MTHHQKHVQVPVIETVEKVVDVPHVRQIDIPHITTIEKHVDVPHVQTVEKHVEVPMVGDTIQGTITHQHTHLPVQREVHPAEVIHQVEQGMHFETHYAGVHQAAVTYGAPPDPAAGGSVTYGAPPAPSAGLPELNLPFEHERLDERMALFSECDANGNGFCSFAEIDAVFRHKFGTGEAEKMMMLHSFDATKNYGGDEQGLGANYVEHNEFRMFLEFVHNGNAPAPHM